MVTMLALSAGSAMADDESFTEIENDVPLGVEVFTFVEDGEDSAVLPTDGWESEDGWDVEDEDDNEFETVNEGDEGSVWQIIA
jgi:hypothetical protein